MEAPLVKVEEKEYSPSSSRSTLVEDATETARHTLNKSIKLEDTNEPQNALTRQFTEAEWEALRSFRVILSSLHIFNDSPQRRKDSLEFVTLYMVSRSQRVEASLSRSGTLRSIP